LGLPFALLSVFGVHVPHALLVPQHHQHEAPAITIAIAITPSRTQSRTQAHPLRNRNNTGSKLLSANRGNRRTKKAGKLGTGLES